MKAENVINLSSVYSNKSVLLAIKSVSVEQQLFTNHNGVSYTKIMNPQVFRAVRSTLY